MQETQKTWVQSLGWKDPLEDELATHSSVLARKFHEHRSLAGYSPWGLKELDTNEHTHIGKIAPTLTIGCLQNSNEIIHGNKFNKRKSHYINVKKINRAEGNIKLIIYIDHMDTNM